MAAATASAAGSIAGGGSTATRTTDPKKGSRRGGTAQPPPTRVFRASTLRNLQYLDSSPSSPSPQPGVVSSASADTDADSFFRPEAIEYHETYGLRHRQGRAVRIVPPWSGPALWALLAVAALGLLAGTLVDVGEYATGPVNIQPDGITFTAVLPEAALSPLKHGQGLEVRQPSGARVTVVPSPDGIKPVDDATAAGLLGPQGSESLSSMSRSLIAVQGRLSASAGAPSGGIGEARVRVRSQPFLWVLLSDLNPASSAA